MNDLISRQAAIDVCLNLLQGEDTLVECPEECDSVAYGAAELIKRLPTAQQWIPCSERYPDMDERVLVYTVAHDYHVWDCMSNRGDNYFWEDEDGLYHDKYEADLWMPLPELRGEEHE